MYTEAQHDTKGNLLFLIKELQHERTRIAAAQPSGVPHVEQTQDLRPPPPPPPPLPPPPPSPVESQNSPVLVVGFPNLNSSHELEEYCKCLGFSLANENCGNGRRCRGCMQTPGETTHADEQPTLVSGNCRKFGVGPATNNGGTGIETNGWSLLEFGLRPVNLGCYARPSVSHLPANLAAAADLGFEARSSVTNSRLVLSAKAVQHQSFTIVGLQALHAKLAECGQRQSPACGEERARYARMIAREQGLSALQPAHSINV